VLAGLRAPVAAAIQDMGVAQGDGDSHVPEAFLWGAEAARA